MPERDLSCPWCQTIGQVEYASEAYVCRACAAKWEGDPPQGIEMHNENTARVTCGNCGSELHVQVTATTEIARGITARGAVSADDLVSLSPTKGCGICGESIDPTEKFGTGGK